MKMLLWSGGGRKNKVADACELGLSPSTSGSNIHLRGIGKPIESNEKATTKKGRLVGARSLKIIVPATAVAVVTCIVCACVLPMTVLWVTSLQSVTRTCTSCLLTEMNVYRDLLVKSSVGAISGQMAMPPLIADDVSIAIPDSAYTSTVPLHTDHSTFQRVFRGIAKQFPTVSNVLVGWQNTEGDHIYCDLQSYWGCHDSKIDSNVTFYYFDGTRRGGDIRVSLTARDWWKIGIDAWNGSWTSVFKSANPAEGRVMGYTLRPAVSVPAVIQVTYTMQFLQHFFSSFNLTKNGLAFLAENKTLKIIAATVTIPVQTQTGGDVFALNCSNSTVKHAAHMWLNNTANKFVENHFTIDTDDNGISYVDVVPITASGGLTLWSFLITPEKDFMSEITKKEHQAEGSAYLSVWIVLACEVLIGICSVVISISLSVILARALQEVIRKLQKVSSGKLARSGSSNVLQRSLLKEIDSLNSEVTIMQSALESFSQYVPTEVVRYLCKNRMKPVVGVSTMHCTVMFLDVVDFTRNMEQYGAKSIIEVLSTMFQSFSTVITKNSGCIDKYIGDAIMALWGCPVQDSNSEMNACRAAAEILMELGRINTVFKAKSLPVMRVRIGIHAGEVQAGNVGSTQRLNYTVLGNTVNLASRLEPLSKELATSVLVSDAVRGAAKDNTFSWRALGRIQVRGFKKPILVHEFLGFTSELSTEMTRMLSDYSTIDSMLFSPSLPSSNKLSPPDPTIVTTDTTTDEDVVRAMECYLDNHPDDYTVTQSLVLFTQQQNQHHSSNLSLM
ncbi:adenylate cyclase [Pelomyxa schiedti]|nr:adenylate cyclase [Pelomyxa schiedti]